MTQLSTIRSSPNVLDGSEQTQNLDLKADVCVIGTGAGGAMAAATLAESGLEVLLLEEGGYYTSADFTMREKDVVPKLFQESGTRATADGGISILQGRAVGGTTVINWTTSFRTPEKVVSYWKKKHQIGGISYSDLIPHFDWVEKRLCIEKVDYATLNKNNKLLYDGCKSLGWSAETLSRNVYSCMQTGMCHLGCPVNAKRSMLVTLIPDAIDAGAKLLFRARVDRFESGSGEVKRLIGSFLGAEGRTTTGKAFTVVAKRFILSGGAINSPAVLLRSGLDSGGIVGKRTFLHPVIGSIGIYDQVIEAYRGAPQSAASHHFSDRGDEVGFFLEAAPWYPSLAGATVPGFGLEHEELMRSASHLGVNIALSIDGFHDDVTGGQVKLRPSGAPVVHYEITQRLWNSLRFAQKKLAEVQFASGAIKVVTLHAPPVVMTGALTQAQIEAQIDSAPFEAGRCTVMTAHQMGGCPMGDDPKSSVVRSEDLRHHQIKNLWVMDGSVFPTSLGVNPQETIYGLTRLMAMRLADQK